MVVGVAGSIGLIFYGAVCGCAIAAVARPSAWKGSSTDGLPRRLPRHAAPDGRASSAVTTQYPKEKAPKPIRAPRPSRPQPLRGRHGEVHRLRAVRRCVPGPVHLRARRRQPARRSGLARASATASSTRSTTCGASTATCASRRAPPRPSPSRSCSSSPSPTAPTPSTPRPSWWSTTTACPSSSRGRTGARVRTSTPRRGCGPPPRRARPTSRASWAGRASWATACGPPRPTQDVKDAVATPLEHHRRARPRRPSPTADGHDGHGHDDGHGGH